MRSAGDRTPAFFAMALTFAVTMMSTTLPTPLYPIYQQQLGFSPLVITIIFAAYAVGVIGALIVTGSWSDQVGRQPLLAGGLGFAAASALVFLWGDGLGPLLLGRVLSGVSAGIFTGTATIAVVELAPPEWGGRATWVATAANMGGLGLGPLLAGLTSQYMPWPVHLCFVLDLLLIMLAGIAVWHIPETVERADRPRLRLQRLRIPLEVRGVFIPAAIAGFAGFSVLGLFTAVAPAFMGEILHLANHALTGAVVCCLFAASMLGQGLQARLPQRIRLPAGCVLLMLGVALIALAIAQAGFALLVAGALVAGVGQGISFRAGMGAVAAASPPKHRGEVASTFFVVLYVAISLPVVGVGLTTVTLGLRIAGIGFAIVVATLALFALLSLIARQRRHAEA